MNEATSQTGDLVSSILVSTPRAISSLPSIHINRFISSSDSSPLLLSLIIYLDSPIISNGVMEDMLLDHTEEFAQLHEKYITYHL